MEKGANAKGKVDSSGAAAQPPRPGESVGSPRTAGRTSRAGAPTQATKPATTAQTPKPAAKAKATAKTKPATKAPKPAPKAKAASKVEIATKAPTPVSRAKAVTKAPKASAKAKPAPSPQAPRTAGAVAKPRAKSASSSKASAMSAVAAAPTLPAASPPASTPAARSRMPTSAVPIAPREITPEHAGPVLWVASEAVPLASTGGLGDVVGAVPSVLRDLGWDVRVCLPYYKRQIKLAVSEPLFTFELPLAETVEVSIRELLEPPGGVPTYLVDCPALFDRGGLYVDERGAFADNPFRYGVFQLAVHELGTRLTPRPAIIHSHDWHAALLPALVRMAGAHGEALKDTRTIFTIHNLQYQGDSDPGLMDALNLPRGLWHPEWAEHFGRFIPLKAAILAADRVTTVSPTYAEELRTPARGMGLDGLIRARGGDMRGLLNGIDDVSWNPATDKHLPANFSPAELEGRAACTKAMRAELGLPDRPDRPLIGFIGRLVNDKGVDLILDALPQLLAMDAQVVVLGSGERALEERLRALGAEFHDEGFRALVKFDLALSRRLYGGLDMLMVPSRHEPCGLVQLYALHYGAIPIVHGVGGLRDTVRDGDNGFVFHEPSSQALADAVQRAVALWADAKAWKHLQQTGLRQDWSWRHAARPYDALYREVLASPARRAHVPLPPPPAPAAPPPPAPPPREEPVFRLMVQGARALFAYWDVQSRGPLELVLEERPSGALFTAAAELDARGERWLGALPDQAYRAFLRAADGRILALSNAVITPMEAPPPPETQAPAWLETAVEVGVFESDPAGRRWAGVFPEAPQWEKTPEGSLEPSWPAPPESGPVAQAPRNEEPDCPAPTGPPATLVPPPPPGSTPAWPAPSAAVVSPARRVLPNLTLFGEAGASEVLHLPRTAPVLAERPLPEVAFATASAHSAALVLPPPPAVRPGPRPLDLRDVRFGPPSPAGSDTQARRASSDTLVHPSGRPA
ncbi:MAG: glycogen/starch synthase [Myxococcales bacterium]|nr:glycogen/starch synthase [Myxococcales bacterium]